MNDEGPSPRSNSPWLIVGLGNPGKKYDRSRHNVGFMAIDRWAERHHLEFNRKREWALVGEGEVSLDGATRRVLIGKSRTFMNLSGDAVIEMVKRHGVLHRRTIIVYDDMDLPLGRLRIREKGSAGGHNGIKSIIERIGTQEFPRIRVGIGRPEASEGFRAVGHVLGEFKGADQKVLDEALARAADAMDRILAKGMQAAMNEFNQ